MSYRPDELANPANAPQTVTGVTTWHVADDGTLRIYSNGRLMLELCLPPDKMADLGTAMWRAADRSALTLRA